MSEKTRNLIVTNARENNLKNISLEIPHDSLTVVTGLSGSGKSSLAFDTVYAEGQRRYIETFSPYTRQFFDKVKKPDVDLIDNVRPAIAIQQRTRITSSRSTVGSMTNINDYLKVLWSNIATPVCPVCQAELKAYSPAKLAELIQHWHQLKPTIHFLICAGLKRHEASTYKKDTKLGQPKRHDPKRHAAQTPLKELIGLGFNRFFNPMSGIIENLEDYTELPLHDGRLLLVLDRIKAGRQSLNKKRLQDSIDQAYSFSARRLPPELSAEEKCFLIQLPREPEPGPRPFLRILNTPEQENLNRIGCEIQEFAPHFSCPARKFDLPKPKASLFSYNHPAGACPECKGFGRILAVDPALCVPNPTLSIKDKAIQCWAGKASRREYRDLLSFCENQGISTTDAWKDLPETDKHKIFYHKSKDYWGVVPWFKWLERKLYKMHVRVFLSRYRTQIECPACCGTRLKPEALAYKVQGLTIADLWQMPVGDLLPWLENLKAALSSSNALQRALIETFRALISRLKYLQNLGLSYLTLDRQARTLSGGETQRVNLAAALGSELISTHFVLDEPSVGLHPRDTNRLIASIRELKERGNSLLVVEHDLDCIRAAENIIELGPGAGEAGGKIVYAGPSSKWQAFKLTLDKNLYTQAKDKKIDGDAPCLSIRKAAARNLKGFDVKIPLQRFVCLTGVSGSGKSTLAAEVIIRAYRHYQLGLTPSGNTNLVSGFENLEQVLLIDQSPLAKSPRANIATYSGIWDEVRDLLAQSDDAQLRALAKSAFSFNIDGGRCPECKGAGFIREDMQFLSDVYIPCEVCLGQRFQPSVLEVRYKGKNVSELLNMTVDKCLEFFSERPAIYEAARVLSELGLGHLTLGHSLSELSGGEAQRLRLVPFVQKSSRGNSLLIFDEPTTGLHYFDVQRLIQLFRTLCGKGHSILCIEHNLSLIATADWIIDLGPEGGNNGGYLIKEGPPAEFITNGGAKNSYTAQYLKNFLGSYVDAASGGQNRASHREPESVPPDSATTLEIKGAREHNLKDIAIQVPLNQIVALTGVSGSGKSTIAKDIIYAEGQRRYLDCLSPYARQFIKELKKPEIDDIKNVKPTICVYQHTFQPGRLSTVATLSEIYNFLRLLYAKTGLQYCPDHPAYQIAPLAPLDIALQIKRLPQRTVRILAPVVKARKGHHRAVFERAIASEVDQIRVDGIILSPSAVNMRGGLDAKKAHTIEFVVGRFNPAQVDLGMIEEAVEQALSLGGGTLLLLSEKEETAFSTERTCPVCKKGFFKPDPEDLSFNSRRGACPACEGRGVQENSRVCRECGGARLNALGRNLRLGGRSIYEACRQTPAELIQFLSKLTFNAQQQKLAQPILRELLSKAQTLIEMGLDHLELTRDCTTLSSGELQRLRLATAMGSSLSGVMYIFDEPSVGLHPLDNRKVLARLNALKERGNSIIMIEHDPQSIKAADYVIDIGPGGGRDGGRVVYSGPLESFMRESGSLTAEALRSPYAFPSAPEDPQQPMLTNHALKIRGANCNNIKGLEIEIPLGCLVTVAGVSGAGKSSLVHGIVGQALSAAKRPGKSWSSPHGKLESTLEVMRLLEVDQKPIGINSRSTPASYLKIWDEIRKLFAATNEARARGWRSGFFSYNSGKGRCPQCRGLGQIKLEMSFLPEAQVLCESCRGSRYTEDAQAVRYLGLSISDVLKLTFEEARLLFANHRRIHRTLHLACELGLGYLTLGQSSTTLSGGESQRIKLVAELSRSRKGHTIYILDEPTTGLHKSDVTRLIRTLKELTAQNNSVIVIEHDPDVILASDYVIELGPGPGRFGGKVIFQGTPAALFRAATPWGEVLQSFQPLRQELLKKTLSCGCPNQA